MIFGRKRKNRDEDVENQDVESGQGRDEATEADGASGGGAAASPSGTESAGAGTVSNWRGGSEPNPWGDVDAKDWRTDGPFDYDEVDLEDDPIERMDLGALIITPVEGMEVRFQIEQSSGRATAVLLLMAESAVELSVYATPRSGNFWPEVRREVVTVTEKQHGTAELAEGPFGVEVRRMMPVTTPDGKNGLQPSRMIMVEGPRWALRAVVYGKAALVNNDGTPEEGILELREVFRDTIVRRGTDPMAPGSLIALTLPERLAQEVRAAAEAKQAAQQAQTGGPARPGARSLPQPSQNYVARAQG